MRGFVGLLALVMPGVALAQDACPTDPAKTDPGLCGCNVADTDWNEDGEADSCIDPTATVAGDAIIGFAARIGANANVGAGASVLSRSVVGSDAVIGAGAVIGSRATIGNNTTIGTDAIIGRSAVVGANAEVGADSVLGRSASWGAGTTSSTGTALGYASSVGADGVLGSNVVIGALVEIGDRLDAASSVVVARSAVLGDDVVLGTGTVLGPEVQLGDGSTTGANVRIRKSSVFGPDAQFGAGARVGRDALFGPSARIGVDAVLRSNVTGGTFATVDVDAYIPRGTHIDDGISAPVITSLTGPPSWQFEPTQDTTTKATATDPQGLDVTFAWSFVSDATGWSLSDATTATPTVTPPPPTGGAETVTLQVVASNGVLQSEQQVDLDLYAQPSCWTYADSSNPGRNRGDGLYYVSPTGNVADSVQVWCDQTTAGGGWMLVSERPGGEARINVEDCGSSVDEFFTLGCGTPQAVGSAASYAIPTSVRSQFPRNAWLIHAFDGLTPDTDDSMVLYTTTDLLAPSASVVDRPIDRACSLDGLCDHEDVSFRYVGDGWFANSLCNTGHQTGIYHGNYALCHAGASSNVNDPSYPTGLLFGDRDGYDESKLWAHETGSAKGVTERIYTRSAPIPAATNAAPVITGASVPSSMLGGAPNAPISVTATDPDGDPLTYQWRVVYSGSLWVLSNSTQATALLRPPAPDSGSSEVTVEVSVFDGQGNVANQVFRVERGTQTSCLTLYNSGFTTSGIYTIDPQDDGNTLDVYCEQELFGGGWTLISNRRQDANNVETCGSRLRDFFTTGCGSTAAISRTDSYALAATDRNRLPKTHMMMLHWNSGVPDFDDGVIIELGSLSDPFPNTSGSVVSTAVPSICRADGSNCDSSGTYWRYAGDGWFANSHCSGGYDTGSYRGNYGYCLNGLGQAVASNGLPGGDRSAYQETKLWGYSSNISRNFQERAFYR